MPIYEYVCPGCSHKFEAIRPLSQSKEDAPCPKCQKSARRKLSTFACYTISESGIPTAVGGTGGSGGSCGCCSSSNCGTCS